MDNFFLWRILSFRTSSGLKYCLRWCVCLCSWLECLLAQRNWSLIYDVLKKQKSTTTHKKTKNKQVLFLGGDKSESVLKYPKPYIFFLESILFQSRIILQTWRTVCLTSAHFTNRWNPEVICKWWSLKICLHWYCIC